MRSKHLSVPERTYLKRSIWDFTSMWRACWCTEASSTSRKLCSDTFRPSDDLAPGDFLEIGFYGTEPNVETIVMRIPAEPLLDEGPFDLHPDRYFESLAA